MWKAQKASARQFKCVIFRGAKQQLHKHLGWSALLAEHWAPAGLSVRDGSEFILMLWNIKAECTFNRSKEFPSAQGLRANDLDHNNALLLNNCSLLRRQPSSVRVIFYLFHTPSTVDLYECHQKMPCHRRALCETADAVFSTLGNILMTLSARDAGSSRRDPASGVWALTWTIHTSVAPQGAFMHIYSWQERGHVALLAQR